jgi:hypothetical protein
MTMEAPKPVESPDFSCLIKCCVEGNARAISEGYQDEDLRQYVYEEAMTAIFGPDYFVWRNQQKW